MKKQTITLIAVFLILFSAISVFARSDDSTKKKATVVEANVWKTEDGQKHFVCPVMKNEGIVTENTPYSIVDGKKYYHCCAGCESKFLQSTAKYLNELVIPANVVKEDKNGKVFQCPVSGELSTVNEKTLFSDVNGKRYYFCCSKCKTNFDANSKKYIKSFGKNLKAK